MGQLQAPFLWCPSSGFFLLSFSSLRTSTSGRCSWTRCVSPRGSLQTPLATTQHLGSCASLEGLLCAWSITGRFYRTWVFSGNLGTPSWDALWLLPAMGTMAFPCSFSHCPLPGGCQGPSSSFPQNVTKLPLWCLWIAGFPRKQLELRLLGV